MGVRRVSIYSTTTPAMVLITKAGTPATISSCSSPPVFLPSSSFACWHTDRGHVPLGRRTQLREFGIHRCDGNCEADSVHAAHDHGIDADHPTLIVDQWSTAVAGIDGCVGLHIALAVHFPKTRNHTRGDRVGKSGRIAD